MKPLRWGILGTGGIAGAFADDLRFAANAQLVAVGSRERDRAVSFASRRAIPYAHGSYEALANDPNVDVIYIATPHTEHCNNTLLCLRAGKHVLVEKPFAVTGAQAREMVHASNEHGRFLMEATWTRFFPLFQKVRELIVSGRIGSVVELRADFGHAVPVDPTSRLWNADLGGGALLDLGVYPLTWAVGLLGFPQDLEAAASFSSTGVDEATGMRLHHANGAVSLLHVSQRKHTPSRVVVEGTAGRITVTAPLYAPKRVVVSSHTSKEPSTWNGSLADLDSAGSPLLGHVDRLPAAARKVWGDARIRTLRNNVVAQVSRTSEPLVDLLPGQGYHYEADVLAQAIAAGQTESALWSLADTVQMADLLDTIRKQIGLVYPFEKERFGR
jgi:predicted dehydrogenase